MYYTGQPQIITDIKAQFQLISTVLKTESSVSVDVLTHADRCVCVCVHVCGCTCALCVCTRVLDVCYWEKHCVLDLQCSGL